eukprot:scaffold6368_cov229-Prasinococcus_capsulatus_cf.AAC.1
MLVYSIYLAGADMSMWPKYDEGNIGEMIRVTQYWVMYSPSPPTTSYVHEFVGVLDNRGNSTLATDAQSAPMPAR